MGRAERHPPSAPRRPHATSGAAPKLALSRKDAAAALGMSLRHFQRHVQPQLDCVYCGQLRLYPTSELERWIRAHTSRTSQKW